MRLRAFFLLTLTMAFSAPALIGQDAGSVELGAFAQFSGSDQQTGLDGAVGAGGLLGFFFAENFSIEAAAGYSGSGDSAPPTGDASWFPVRGRILYSHPARERVRPFIGVSAVRNMYSGVVDGSDFGAGGVLGLKLFVNDNVAFRTDLSVDRVWAPFNEGAMIGEDVVDTHNNWAITTGFTYTMGGTPRDSDADGVPDRDDQCLMTPMGVGVDAAGCRLDTDGDGVFDEADSCAGTRSGVRVDARGCRVDADGDGVFDEADTCANTPSGVRVDASGCRVDTDGDGVFDEADRCANTPSGVRVDGRGCRVDTDGDGVFDEADRCANSPRGSAVSATGCPVLFEAEETSLVLEGVTFETSSADLTDDARVVLGRVAEALNGNPTVRVRITGHTDAVGARAFNVTLSQSRAESVRAYLTSRGVAANRMEAQGLGPDRPIANGSTPEGRRLNRRVELERINR